MAKLPLLTSDKKHVSILQNIEIDKELPKYRVMSEASNGATDEFDDIARAIKKGVDVSDELSTTLSYDVLKKYFLEKGDMEITSFNINVSDKMRRTIDKTRITANFGNSLTFGPPNPVQIVNGETKKKGLFDVIRDYFKSKKQNNNEDSEEEKIAKEFDVIKFFSDVKNLTGEEAEKYRDRLEEYINCIGYTEKSGQVALKERLFEQLVINKYESILYSKGLFKAISEETMVKLAENCPKALGIDYIKNYTRSIPVDAIKKKMEIDKLEVFDNYCILHYDETGESTDMTVEEKEAEAKRRRDPIMFGLISGSKKLYYICDWVTPDDDITLDKVIEILGKEIVESDFLKEKIESV